MYYFKHITHNTVILLNVPHKKILKYFFCGHFSPFFRCARICSLGLGVNTVIWFIRRRRSSGMLVPDLVHHEGFAVLGDDHLPHRDPDAFQQLLDNLRRDQGETSAVHAHYRVAGLEQTFNVVG